MSETSTPPVVTSLPPATPLVSGHATSTVTAPIMPQVAPAQVSTTSPVTKPPFVYPTLAATQKLQDVEAFYVKWHGHAGYNPHFFLNREYLPLKAQHESPDVPKTEELFKKIMALECKEENAKANGSKYYGNRTVVASAIVGLSNPAVRNHVVKQNVGTQPVSSSLGANLIRK